MKRIITITVLSILISLLILLMFFFIMFVVNFQYKEEPFDINLNHYTGVRKFIILNKLKYKVKRKVLQYKKKKFNIIFFDREINNYDYMKGSEKIIIKNLFNWVENDKRLILYYNTRDNTDDLEYKDNNYTSFKVKKKHQLFEGVEELYINKNKKINLNDDIFKNKQIKPVLFYKKNLLLAEESLNEGEVIYIADETIFSDKSVLRTGNPVLLNNLLKKYYNEKVVFDMGVIDLSNVSGEKSYMYKTPFIHILIQLIIFTVIFFLVFIKRFGAPVDLEKYSKRSILRHLEAVGFFFEKTKNNIRIAKLFDQYFIERLSDILKLRSKDAKSIFSYIKKRYQLSEDEEKILSLNNVGDIMDVEIEREKFIKKLKRG